ncbi:MAG: hypothetical protein K6G07_08335, partial [Lachnospiraceae bacterium]|nr:hypothetical protein [Lachnospiraceae bacterium]
MKELEHEYQNAISLDAPDLWSRIEAGVDAYEAEKKKEAGPEAVGVTAQTTQTVEQEAQPAEEVKTQTTAKKKSGAKLVYLYRFGAIAAAMFFLFIVVRAVNLNRTGTTNETASEAPMQEASEATMEEAAEEPMYEESSDMAMEEASEAPMEEAESEAMMEATADETAQEAAEEAP